MNSFTRLFRRRFPTQLNFTLLTKSWNADPNAPEPKLTVVGEDVVLEFFLNNNIYSQFSEHDKGRLTFYNCHKYDFNGTNDHGYYLGQHRYNYKQLPWGEFYKLDTDWETDFPINPTYLSLPINKRKLNHYIFFFRDECFECVAESYDIHFY